MTALPATATGRLARRLVLGWLPLTLAVGVLSLLGALLLVLLGASVIDGWTDRPLSLVWRAGLVPRIFAAVAGAALIAELRLMIVLGWTRRAFAVEAAVFAAALSALLALCTAGGIAVESAVLAGLERTPEFTGPALAGASFVLWPLLAVWVILGAVACAAVHRSEPLSVVAVAAVAVLSVAAEAALHERSPLFGGLLGSLAQPAPWAGIAVAVVALLLAAAVAWGTLRRFPVYAEH